MSDPSTVPPAILVDLAAGRLKIDDRAVGLRPKTWEVLRALVERPGQLITKNELLDRVWADTAVSEGTLNKSIGELRAAFDDSRESPRCIETVSRRGFRWIGEARILAAAGIAAPFAELPTDVSSPGEAGTPGRLVARSAEVARLDAALVRARTGKRQVVFIAGEAGAGKTTLVDHFLDGAAAGGAGAGPIVAHAQCLETSGLHEPYLPLLDALERLTRDAQLGDMVTGVLRRCAPTWVAQMPALLRGDASGAAPMPGSMLRELIAVFDEIARTRPVILALEDAHWADLATTDACAAMARRRDPAQLLVVITMRSAEAMLSEHPIVALRQDLVSRTAGEVIDLAPFAAGDLRDYLESRCHGLEQRDETVDWLLSQTAGNPLFVRLVLDEWIARRLVAEGSNGAWSPQGDAEEMRQTVPDSLRALLDRQVARLGNAERAILEAASVRIGAFPAASVAAAAGVDDDDAEELCESIARRGGLLRDAGETAAAGGRLASQYAFLHATVQNVVVAGLPASRRRRLHLAAAEQLEREHAGGTASVAALLAVHYEAAGDVKKAVESHLAAAKLAMHRDAPHDAIAMLEGALLLMDASHSAPALEDDRVLVLKYLTHARQLAFGFADPKVRELWSRTSELAASSENFQERLVADAGSIVSGCVSGRYAEAEATVRAALPMVERVTDAGALKTFFFAAGTLLYRMAMMTDSCAIFERGLSMTHEGDALPGADLDALLISQYAPAVALAGKPDEVRRMAEVSLARARVHSHYSECTTAAMMSWALVLLNDHEAATPIALRAMEIANADNFPTWTTRQQVVVGLLAMADGRTEEGMQQIRAGMDGRKQEGQLCDHSAMCCLVAEALMNAGLSGAETLLDEAADFCAETGELYAESEVYRLRARILVPADASAADREPLLRRALDLAQLRGIHWHAMLAAADLAAILVGDGRSAEARALLEPALAAVAGHSQLAAIVRAREILARCSNV